MKDMIRFSLIAAGIVAFSSSVFARNVGPVAPPQRSAACDFEVLSVSHAPSCAGGSDGSITLTVTGDNDPFQYVWANGTANQPLAGISSGDYEVTITDTLGCVQINTIHVGQPAPLTLALASVSGFCGGDTLGTVTVQASGGVGPYQYAWPSHGGASGATISGVGPGNFFAEATDANGCTASLPMTFAPQNSINLTLVEASAECPGVANGTATAIVDPPTGNFSYAWNIPNSPSAPQLTGLAANTFVVVTVTDWSSGCTATASVTISGHNHLQVAVQEIDVNCSNDPTGAAIATASNGTAPYDYVWTMPDGSTVHNDTISGLTSGAYPLFVTDAHGCTAVNAASIGALSDLSAAYSMEIIGCDSAAVTVVFHDESTSSSPITSWSWNIVWGTGQVQTMQQTPDTIVLPANQTGTVQLTVTSAAGCTDMLSEQFSVTNLTDITFGVTLPAKSCGGAQVEIPVFGNPNYVYEWSPLTGLNVTTPQLVIANPTQSTTYTLTVKNGTCQKTLDVPVLVAPLINLSLPSDTTTCATQPISLMAAATASPLDFDWSTGDSTATISVHPGPTKTYSVTATDAIGCTAVAQTTITGIGAEMHLAALPSTLCENFPIPVEAISDDPTDVNTYVWTANSPDLTISPANAAATTVTGPNGKYILTLLVTNQHGCTTTLQVSLDIEKSESLSGKIKADLCDGLPVSFENLSSFAGTWSFGDGSTSTDDDPTHIYAAAGPYHVIFTPNATQCVAVFDTLINVKGTSAVAANFGQDLQGCLNEATFIFHDSTAHTDPLAQWIWTFPPTNATANGANPTVVFPQNGPVTAVLTVIDVNGCADTLSRVLPFHIIVEEIAPDQEYCGTQTVPLNPAANPEYTYNWSATPADAVISANPANPSPVVTPSVPTTYTVSIVYNSCEVTRTVTLTPKEAAAVQASLEKTDVCSDAPVTVTASGNGVTFVWHEIPSNATIGTGNSIAIVPVQNGIYYVDATAANGCGARDTFWINNGTVSLDYQADWRICKDMAVQLKIGNNFPSHNLTYQWSPAIDPPVADPIVHPTSDQTYKATVTNQFGCTAIADFSVDVVDLALTATTDKDTICPGEVAHFSVVVAGGNNANLTYHWEPAASLSDPFAPDPVASPTQTTDYTVTVMDADLGCPATASLHLTFLTLYCQEPYIFVPKVFTPDNNGKNDVFRVRGMNIKEMYFVIYDRWGEKVFETNNPEEGWDGTFKDKDLTPDAYGWYLKVLCVDGEEFIKKGDVTLLK